MRNLIPHRRKFRRRISRLSCFSSSRRYQRTSLKSFTEEEMMIRSSVERFAKDIIRPKVQEMDRIGNVDPDVIKQLFEQGMMGVETEVEYGGSGMSFTSSIIAIEEISKVDPGIGVIVDVHNTVVQLPIRKFATEEQKKRYLPRLTRECLGSFCLSEWSSGSDAFALKTTAVKKGDNYILNGSKAWISNANDAGLFIVFANVDFSKGYKGITAFVIDRKNPGIKVGKKENKLGIRASSTCEVILQDCVVSEKDILGDIGKGYKIAIEVLNEGRIGIGAQMVGLARGALDETMPYIIQRKQFGQSIALFQGMQFDYARCAMEIEAATLLIYNAARLREEEKPYIKEAAMAKYYSSIIAEKVSSTCVNMLGGVGYSKEFTVEKYFRDCKIGQIYEGTNNIQLQTIANLILKEYGVK